MAKVWIYNCCSVDLREAEEGSEDTKDFGIGVNIFASREEAEADLKAKDLWDV
jgi:hypothetical protein